MISSIVQHINELLEPLGFIKERRGLAELIKKTQDEVEITFPAEYCGKDEYKQISDFDYKQGLTYHRLNGVVATAEEEEEKNTGCALHVQKTYPLRLVGVINKNFDDRQYIDVDIAETISNVISSASIKTLATTLKADSVSIIATEYDVDRYAVHALEYEGIPMNINFNYAYIAVNYEVVVSADIGCFTNLCD